jgi:hypothetical protein
MASAFKNALAASVGTVSTDIYTAPALTSTTVIGLSIANTTTVDITASATVTKGGTTVHLVKNGPIPSGGALVLFGGDQKLVLEAGNKISVVANTASSADVVISVLEIA